MTLRKLPKMTIWRVRHYNDGVWDEVAPRIVEAATALAAAEAILGSGVQANGPEGAYCLSVWRAGEIPEPTYFWPAPVAKRPASPVIQRDQPCRASASWRASHHAGSAALA